MKIYTKKGDRGETSLFGGKRVSKNSIRIEAYGTVDELNSHLGFARTLNPSTSEDAALRRLQEVLFVLGADLATPMGGKTTRVAEEHVLELESTIDRLENDLPPLKNFILPGGSPLGAQLHVARTVCRRAERFVTALSQSEDLGPCPLKFLNRLSDLLFVMARHVNHSAGATETPWNPA
ncbi:MAG: cob(I)yrinic acid a,c-diamide adenosyltransferase [Bacteroidota bacterium]